MKRAAPVAARGRIAVAAPRRTAPAAAVGRQRVQSAEIGISMLKGLARLGGPSSLTALAAEVGESPAKVHRYLASLIREGMVAQQGSGAHYALGPEAIRIGLAAVRQCDAVRLAEPALVALRETLQVTSFVAVMGNCGPTILRFEEPALPVTVNVRAGSVLSMLWSATGRVFLAFADADARVLQRAADELAAAAPEQRRLLDRRRPIERLRERTRAERCAVVEGSYLRGISAVAAPVHDFTGRVCAVLTALGASGGFDASADGAIARAVRAHAAAVSGQLGFAGDVAQAVGASRPRPRKA